MERDDLTGRSFGRWTVIGFGYKSRFGELLWNCKCECGREKAVKAAILRKGESTSCGCLHREAVTTHGMSNTRTFKSWDTMKQRCFNSNAPDFDRYGGRGIKVCERWRTSFSAFLEDMGERPEGYTLDRIDNEGDYELDNCKWSTGSEQQQNTRVSIWLTIGGETRPLKEWAKVACVGISSLRRRYHAGWKHEDIVYQPATKGN